MRSAPAFVVVVALVGAVGAAQAEVAPPPADVPRLTLRDAIARAIEHNPRVLSQLEELHRSQAQIEEVRAAALPTLTGNGVYTRIDAPRTTGPGGVVIQGADSVNANIAATVPLLAPRAWVQWSQARASAQVSALGVGDIKRQVAIAVASAYLGILTQRRQLELNERARDTARAHASYTHLRLGGGMGSRLDDVRAQQELQSDEGLVLSSRLALARAQETLGVLVGAESPVDAADEPSLEVVDPRAALDEAPRLRADLLQLDARRALTRKIAREDWADYLPSLSAIFEPIYSFPGTDFLPTWSWQLQLVLTVPFYDGGLRYGLARERRALMREAAIDQTGALRQTRSDLRIGDEAIHRTAEALARARGAAELAHEALRIADLAYHAGATTNLEVIDAERRARDSDTAAAIAENAARQARLDVLFASGRLP